MIKKVLVTNLFFVLLFNFVKAQDTLAPFYKDIQYFKRLDSSKVPPKNAILFIGSSSFTKWVRVQDDFPKYTIINRGFGGSSLPDVIRYADDIIFPYQPRQIIIYCGENDIAAADSITAKIVFTRFRHLFQLIRIRMPKVAIAFVSMKPSPSRQKFWSKMEEGNDLIKKYLKKKQRTAFIDVSQKMFNPDGTVMTDIFVQDNLHMNAKGYEIWQKIIEPYLSPELK